MQITVTDEMLAAVKRYNTAKDRALLHGEPRVGDAMQWKYTLASLVIAAIEEHEASLKAAT